MPPLMSRDLRSFGGRHRTEITCRIKQSIHCFLLDFTIGDKVNEYLMHWVGKLANGRSSRTVEHKILCTWAASIAGVLCFANWVVGV